MGTVAERWKIEAVLALVRQVEACDFFVAGEYDPSSKTRAFMRLVEFDYRDVRRSMRGLEVEDYCEEPLSDDKGRLHDLWVFGAYVAQFETYIKFAIYVVQGTVKSICVSFHEAERPLSYPYRKAS